MSEPPQNRVLRFFSNPIIGIVGSVASVVSVVLAILFYAEGKETRELVYVTHPIRTVLARGDRPGGLKISFMGEPLSAVDIVALQLALWNHGKLSIRPENILNPVEVHLEPPGRVLEASVVKPSREIIGLKVSDDREFLRKGRIPISWRIMEQGDGGIIQIVYAGTPEAVPKIIGIIEGQGSPRDVTATVQKKSSESTEKGFGKLRTKRLELLLGFLVVSFVCLVFIGGSIALFREATKKDKLAKWGQYLASFLLFVGSLAVLVLGASKLLSDWFAPTPPPGF